MLQARQKHISTKLVSHRKFKQLFSLKKRDILKEWNVKQTKFTFLVQKKDIILSWTFVDIYKNVCSVEELIGDIKNGESPHEKWLKKAYLNLNVTGCETSTDHKLHVFL